MNAHSTLPIDRRTERTHLFLVATLSFGRASTPVRVRNLSATGALVESIDVPPSGTEIVLRRGALEAVGSVAWAEKGKAGLTFREPVAVSCWLPVKDSKQQSQRDQLILQPAALVTDGAPCVATLVAELSAVQADLGQLGSQLARDAVLVARHADPRLLVAAEQRIARIVAALVADSKDRPAAEACLHS